MKQGTTHSRNVFTKCPLAHPKRHVLDNFVEFLQLMYLLCAAYKHAIVILVQHIAFKIQNIVLLGASSELREVYKANQHTPIYVNTCVQ